MPGNEEADRLAEVGSGMEQQEVPLALMQEVPLALMQEVPLGVPNDRCRWP